MADDMTIIARELLDERDRLKAELAAARQENQARFVAGLEAARAIVKAQAAYNANFTGESSGLYRALIREEELIERAIDARIAAEKEAKP